MPLISSDIKKNLFKTMLRIRAAEEKIVDVYTQQQLIRTPTHLSIGQEAVAAGVCAALEKEDPVFAGHRCHAAYLAKGGDLEEFFAELCGRKNGSSQGRAGSAHLTDPVNRVFSSPILGAMIPVAVGAALSFAMDGRQNLAVVFLGDGAIEEGVFAESLNFALTRKLPVLFVCENNLYSTHSPLSVRQPAISISQRLRVPGFKTQQIDGNDVLLVYQTVSQIIHEIRRGQGPGFVECLTYRIYEHVGPLLDYDKGYRSLEEGERWKRHCPIQLMRTRLRAEGIYTEAQMSQLESDGKAFAHAAYEKALCSPWPLEEDLLKFVY